MVTHFFNWNRFCQDCTVYSLVYILFLQLLHCLAWWRPRVSAATEQSPDAVQGHERVYSVDGTIELEMCRRVDSCLHANHDSCIGHRTKAKGCTMALVVVAVASNRKARFWSWANTCEICGAKIGSVTDFLRVLRFSTDGVIPPMLHIYFCINEATLFVQLTIWLGNTR
jgi:hypothetical protein